MGWGGGMEGRGNKHEHRGLSTFFFFFFFAACQAQKVYDDICRLSLSLVKQQQFAQRIAADQESGSSVVRRKGKKSTLLWKLECPVPGCALEGLKWQPAGSAARARYDNYMSEGTRVAATDRPWRGVAIKGPCPCPTRKANRLVSNTQKTANALHRSNDASRLGMRSCLFLFVCPPSLPPNIS